LHVLFARHYTLYISVQSISTVNMKLLNIFQILFLAISSFETNKKDADGFLNDSGSRKAHGERGKETGRYFRDKYKHGRNISTSLKNYADLTR